MNCTECHQPQAYVLETFPDGHRTLRAWCVNGERGCKLAGKHVEHDPAILTK